MHEYAPRQREHLGLILQTAKWRRKYEPIEVALKVAPCTTLGVVEIFEAETLVVNQPVPMHHLAIGIHNSPKLHRITQFTCIGVKFSHFLKIFLTETEDGGATNFIADNET